MNVTTNCEFISLEAKHNKSEMGLIAHISLWLQSQLATEV